MTCLWLFRIPLHRLTWHSKSTSRSSELRGKSYGNLCRAPQGLNVALRFQDLWLKLQKIKVSNHWVGGDQGAKHQSVAVNSLIKVNQTKLIYQKHSVGWRAELQQQNVEEKIKESQESSAKLIIVNCTSLRLDTSVAWVSKISIS